MDASAPPPGPLPLARLGLRHAGVALACLGVGVASIAHWGVSHGLGAFSELYRGWPWLDMWIRWDARWYEEIATHGYSFTPGQQSSVAFFPLYPLLLRALTATGAPVFPAGVAATFLLGLVGQVLFFLWCRKLAGAEAAWRAGWVLALWPLAFFLYGAVYSDALFLSLVLAAFLGLEHRRPGWAVLFGALATATRPIAPALVLGMVARGLELRWREERRVRPVDLFPALSVAGLLAYMAFQAHAFGTPTAFIEAQAGWSQTPGLGTWLKLDLFRSPDLPQKALRLALHAGLALWVLALAWPTARKLGVGYGVYVAAAMGLPVASSAQIIGLGRYALAAFPALLTWTLLLERRPRALVAWLAGSAVLLGICVSKFALGRYIS